MNHRKMSSQAKSRMKAVNFKVVRNKWSEKVPLEDLCRGHTDGTDLSYTRKLTHRRGIFRC